MLRSPRTRHARRHANDRHSARSRAGRRVRSGLRALRAPRFVPRRGAWPQPRLLLPAGSAVRAGGRAPRRRRACAGDARGQRQRPAVHRRPCRDPALRDAACARLRHASRRGAARRCPRFSIAGSPTRSSACPRTTSRARRRSAPATATSPRTSPGCWRAARCLPSGASRTMRRCGRSGRSRPGSPSRTGRGTRSGAAGALFDSYHCSRYNTSTRRLTAAMFDAVIAAAARHVREAGVDDGR